MVVDGAVADVEPGGVLRPAEHVRGVHVVQDLAAVLDDQARAFALERRSVGGVLPAVGVGEGLGAHAGWQWKDVHGSLNSGQRSDETLASGGVYPAQGLARERPGSPAVVGSGPAQPPIWTPSGR